MPKIPLDGYAIRRPLQVQYPANRGRNRASLGFTTRTAGRASQRKIACDSMSWQSQNSWRGGQQLGLLHLAVRHKRRDHSPGAARSPDGVDQAAAHPLIGQSGRGR
ncbi:MAG: hypothetical protein RLZZ366_920 [Pseudomonadota bacterium]